MFIYDTIEGFHNNITFFEYKNPILAVAKEKEEASKNLNQELDRVRLWINMALWMSSVTSTIYIFVASGLR